MTFVRFAKSVGLFTAVFALLFAVNPLHAQRDTARAEAPAAAAPPPAVLKPPITPRRAFFYSFLLPGYSQAKLGRHKAAATFMLVEAISLAMIRESEADVHEARRTENDSVVVVYVSSEDGTLAKSVAPPRFNGAYVRTRSAHVEDWAALLVANHLFAGADAFVAAHLWDLPARLGLRILPHSGGTTVSASFKW